MTTRNHRIRFCDNNLAAGVGATLTASSALAANPLSNLTHNFRFKTWKPAGNFTITTSNRTIYFNTGADLSANITTGNYTPATLATAIAAAMNSVSTNWTCTYSTTTFKFTIGRSSGTAILRFSQTTTAVWDTIGYTGSVDTATSTGLAADEQRNHTSESIVFNLGVASEIGFFGLLGPLGEVFSISSSATVRLYANTTDSWTSPALTVTLTPDNNGIYKFIDDETSRTYRYWKFEFIDKLNTVGPEGFEFGHVYLGDYTTIETRNVGTGFSKVLVDTSTSQQSESGAEYYQTGFKYTQFDSVQIAYMDADDRRGLEQVFYDLGRSTPFYVSLDPTLIVSDDQSELTRYVVFTNDPVFTHIKSDIYSVRMAFKEVM
jgi:hypothetical protein